MKCHILKFYDKAENCEISSPNHVLLNKKSNLPTLKYSLTLKPSVSFSKSVSNCTLCHSSVEASRPVLRSFNFGERTVMRDSVAKP